MDTLAELHEKHKERKARIAAAALKEPSPVKITIPPNSFDIIMSEFCVHFGVRPEDIMSHRRINYICVKRQLLCYMVYWLTDYTNPQIAGRLKKDPTTILHAIKKIQSNLPLYRKDIEDLETRIKPLLPQKRKP